MKKTNSKGKVERLDYLQKLVNEFQHTKDIEAKLEVIANLANFSYNPENHINLNQLGVVDLFLGTDNARLETLALAGLCNLSSDKEIRKVIINHDGLTLLLNCLSNSEEELVRNALTTLLFLLDSETVEEIATIELVDALTLLKRSVNVPLANIAEILLKVVTEES